MSNISLTSSGRCLLHRGQLAVPGVVDHHIEPSEVRLGASDCVEDSGPVGDVQGQGEHPLPVRLGETVQTSEIPGSARDQIASLERRNCPFVPETARGARDEPDLLDSCLSSRDPNRPRPATR